MRNAIVFFIAALFTSVSLQAFADPPDHAPAHGWRKKHDQRYVGYTGTTWEEDYEVATGHCNREAIGAVLGGVAGGVIGSKVASPENRTVGILLGAAAGAIIGAKIGRDLDDGDRGCFGHALEIVRPGGRVMWDNPATGVSYVLVPGKGRGEQAASCREFTLIATRGREKSTRKGVACQTERGVWKIA
ncbi:MAG TPA: glycine zipper 2TM domain-containing protein [Steroidobacteraceae bacterium]|nr:glycine zipper 2TM domain-containing protein [Steroidobacteraceae bacterium]